MKNLSVGKKIMLGFGLVIVMIALILAISTITSISRNNNLNRVDTMSSLQNEANKMLDEFNLSRVEIRSVFTSIDNDEEYAAAQQLFSGAMARLDTMEAYSAELGGYMQEELKTLHNLFQQVAESLEHVHENDLAALSDIAVMTENGTTMVESAAALMTTVNKTITDIGVGDPAAGMERFGAVMEATQEVDHKVAQVRLESRRLMYLQELAAVPELYAGLDELQQMGNTVRSGFSTQEARDSIDSVLSAAAGFRSSIEKVAAVLEDSEATVASARANFTELAAAVDQYVVAISEETTELIGSAITTSSVVSVIMIVIGVIAVVISVLIAVILGRSITVPLGKMKSLMLQAGTTGNLKFSEEVKADIMKEAEAKDEIGQSLGAFTQFVDQITYIADCLQRIADKDLTVDIRLLSQEDTMGVSLKGMAEQFNIMFEEISGIAGQVAASSHEIAVGAQTLAQGSTEQAATIEEISASVTEINEQMTVSNQTVMGVADKGNEISKVALEGNVKMDQMMGSMVEINNASQAIGRVIKVIDDIAFQTNILALNAAVEAARAGQHGKGFAVVADEVRNLAAKSAGAAKETAALISENIEKTEMGVTFTQDTAESLKQIIEGIGITNDSLQTVAEQSDRTKVATAQVTSAIDQVAQVIQQNSATSEESAAASQEMSSQAQILQEFMSGFKLKRGVSASASNVMEYPRAGAPIDSEGLSLSPGVDKY